jgi:hypothetical protein
LMEYLSVHRLRSIEIHSGSRNRDPERTCLRSTARPHKPGVKAAVERMCYFIARHIENWMPQVRGLAKS